MITIENEFLRVTIRSKGAELTSFFNKKNQVEHLWQADPAVWGWHAPNLFPVVGGCLDNQLHVDAKTYPMERHGFARHSEFTPVDSTPTEARFALAFSEKTLAVYPFKFTFEVDYRLDGPALRVTYHVQNGDEKPMYFSVGAHPAFNVPFYPHETYADYFLEFEKEEILTTHRLSAAGYFTGQTGTVPTEKNRLALSEHLFDQDALVFKNLESRQVVLKSRNHDQQLVIAYPDFNYLGLWAKPGARFVCIEPWLGCADTEGEPVAIDQKEAIQRVEPGQTVNAGFRISTGSVQ